MFHTRDRRVAEPERLPELLGEGSGHDEPEQHQRRQDDRHDRDGQVERAQLPERPALVDLVDLVHRPAERTDVAGRAPQRTDEPEHQGEPGRVGLGHLGDRLAQLVDGIVLTDAIDQLEQRVGRRLALAEHAEQRDHRQQGREQRQHGVVREGGGEVGALVAAELGPRLLERRTTTIARSGRRASPACERHPVAAPGGSSPTKPPR